MRGGKSTKQHLSQIKVFFSSPGGNASIVHDWVKVDVDINIDLTKQLFKHIDYHIDAEPLAHVYLITSSLLTVKVNAYPLRVDLNMVLTQGLSYSVCWQLDALSPGHQGRGFWSQGL